MAPIILLVDDSKTMRHVLRVHLVGSAGDFLEADSGRRALEILESEQVDLVVCDVRMADMDGLEVVRRTRRRETFGTRLPFVLISGDRSEGLRAQCFIAGADEFLPKPVDPVELRRVVDELSGSAREVARSRTVR